MIAILLPEPRPPRLMATKQRSWIASGANRPALGVRWLGRPVDAACGERVVDWRIERARTRGKQPPSGELLGQHELLDVVKNRDRNNHVHRAPEVDVQVELNSTRFDAVPVRADVRDVHAGLAQVRPAQGLQPAAKPAELRSELRRRDDHRRVQVDGRPVEVPANPALDASVQNPCRACHEVLLTPLWSKVGARLTTGNTRSLSAYLEQHHIHGMWSYGLAAGENGSRTTPRSQNVSTCRVK